MSFIPFPPSGIQQGFINIDYEYTIYTSNLYAQWKFDWGDGTASTWVSLSPYETSLIQIHHWDNPGKYSVRVQFKNAIAPLGIWSEPLIVTIAENIANTAPDPPTIIRGTQEGCISTTYRYSISTVDLDNDYVQYQIQWGDDQYSGWTPLIASTTTITISHNWETEGEYLLQARVRDQYGLVSLWSDPYKIVILKDSDGDNLADNIEQQLGSNSADATDVTKITLNKQNYFLVFTSSTILFYDEQNKKIEPLSSITEGIYQLDLTHDGTFEYLYDSSSGTLIPYEQNKESDQLMIYGIPLLYFLILIIGIIILCVYILFKLGYITIYQEYVIVE